MFNAYTVAVKLTLINEVTGALALISRGLKGVDNDATAAARKLGILGAATATTGIIGLGIMGKTVEAAKGYAHQLSLINTLGLKHAEVSQIINKSWETSREVVTTTAAENMLTVRELRSAFGYGHEGEALSILPTVQRAKAILTALTGKEQEHVGFDMVKAIELRTPGVMTEAAMKRNAELMTQTLIGMGGTLNISDYHQALKYAKTPAMKWDDDFTYKYLPTFMQEMKSRGGGASSAGVALRTFDRAVHGRLQKSAMPLWVDSGLVAQSDIVKNATGHWQMKPGAMKGLELEESSPFLWVQQYLAPAIQKVMQKRNISDITAINAMFSDPNAAFTAYTFYKKAQQFERDKKLIEQADSIGAYNKLLKNDPVLAEQALHKQWQNMLSILGYQIMPDLLKGTGWLIEKIRDLTGWFRENKDLAKGLVYSFAGISAVLAVGGTLITGLAMTRIAFKGLGRVLAFKSIGGIDGISKLGMALTGTATGLRALTTAAGHFAAAYAGWKIGEVLGDKIDKSIQKNSGYGTSSLRDWLDQSRFGQATGWFKYGQNEALHFQQAPSVHNDSGSRFVAGKIDKPINVTVVSKLNDREIARAVTKVQSREGSRPPTGGSSFDGSMSARPVGAGAVGGF